MTDHVPAAKAHWNSGPWADLRIHCIQMKLLLAAMLFSFYFAPQFMLCFLNEVEYQVSLELQRTYLNISHPSPDHSRLGCCSQMPESLVFPQTQPRPFADRRIAELFVLRGTLRVHVVLLSCNQKEHLQGHHVTSSPVQPWPCWPHQQLVLHCNS